jgi:hypothetical protein
MANFTARGPAADLASELMLFGQFVGDWDVAITYWHPDGTQEEDAGEWSFAWILEGHAVQDVWRIPSRAESERTGRPVRGLGTTIRFFDRTIGAWRSTWHGINGYVLAFIARQIADEIVLERSEGDVITRWIFSEVQSDQFRWRNVTSTDNGSTWRHVQEMRVIRKERPLA